MRRVVIESPYAGDIPGNVAYAKRAVHDCLSRNEAPLASHLLFTQDGILRDDMVGERKLGIAAGLAWQSAADAIVVYTDRGISAGMKLAIKRAERFNIPVEYRSLHPTAHAKERG